MATRIGPQANPHEEALRYLDNAKETLQKANKQDGLYRDKKYVRMGSGAAYSGVLVALDGYLRAKEGSKFRQPKSIEEYRARVGKYDRKLLALLSEAYTQLHIVGYYYGTDSVQVIQNGLEAAYKIIDFAKE